ncbi:hypothetical protein [Thalassotalea sp. PLHSN55]|uniref:hypothetical protein n=1 Tax=Thalassotalea sp. PLHSN55 TaxID=3435888 RepID=UPI003F859487
MKNNNKHSITTKLSQISIAVALAATSANAFADSLAGEFQQSIIDQGKAYFTNLVDDAQPTIITAIDGETWAEQTARVQAAIDAASLEHNGGVVQLVGEHFRLGHIELKNNVRVEVDPAATIDMMEKVLFDMGRGASNWVLPERQQNIEVTSMVQGEKFTINVNRPVKKRNAIPFRVGYVYNYALSHFHIDDYYTIFPSVFIVADSDNRKEWHNSTYDRISFKGAIVNASSDEVHTGYALVQPFSGKRIYMKDLTAEGGLTIRLEPGSGKSNDWLNRAGPEVGNIAEVRLINIHNTDGMAALFLKSHEKIISDIHATNITATDSAFAVMSNSSDSKVFQRGRFENIKVDGLIKLDFTIDEPRADIGPSSQYFIVDSHLAQLQADALIDFEAGNRNNSNPIYGDLPLSPTGDMARRETKPMAPVLMASADSAETAGSRFLGRWHYDISSADIQGSDALALEHDTLTLYREEARLLNGRPGTDWAQEKAWDMDGDGTRNRFEDDFDGDLVLNEDDAFPYDKDETIDSDGDGYGDNSDKFPYDPSEWLDTDNDNIGNNLDSDDDNDGHEDSQDAFALDASEWLDTDDDNIGNNADLDDDHDGVADSDDPFPLDARLRILGDLDGDDDIDAMDIRAFNFALRNGTTLPLAFDLNNDGNVDRRDTRYLTKLCTNNRCGVK